MDVVNKQQLFLCVSLLLDCPLIQLLLCLAALVLQAGHRSPASQKSKDKARHCSLHCSFSVPHCSPISPPQRTSSHRAHPLVPRAVEIPQEHTYHCWIAQLCKMQIYASPRVPTKEEHWGSFSDGFLQKIKKEGGKWMSFWLPFKTIL